MATLKALQKCSKVKKYAVFGFIRLQSESLSLPHIPTIIDYLCLSYYLPNTDFFREERDKERIKLSMDQLTATVIKHKFGNPLSIVGHHWIDSLSPNKHEWKFMINSRNGIIEFGLTANDTNKPFDRNVKPNKYNYSLRIDHARYAIQIFDKIGVNKFVNSDNYRNISTAKTVLITLKNQCLSIAINDQFVTNKVAMKTGKNIKYRMAVVMRDQFDSITIEKYNDEVIPEYDTTGFLGDDEIVRCLEKVEEKTT